MNKIVKENLNGAEIILAALEAEGVDIVFGYPGGSVLPLYDALYKNKNIKHILTRHEQGAVHAADGYARSTGKCGVVIATSGPGATNLTTGLANAYMDSVPLVAITGQVGRDLLGKDSFQEADVTGITLPISKYNYLVQDVKDLPRILTEAFYLATSGRPGPVVVDVPKDVTTDRTDFIYPAEMDLPGYNPTVEPNMKEIVKAIDVIVEAEKPIVFVGGGVRNSKGTKEVLALLKNLNMPVTYSLMGKGVLPDKDSLSLGMVGMHGTAYANYAMSEADLIIGIGVRFDDRVTGNLKTYAPNAKIVHVDIDPAEINKNVLATVAVHGDAKASAVLLNEELNKRTERKDITLWREQMETWKNEHPLTFVQDGKIKPQYVMQQINEKTKGKAYITTEVGQHQMWAAQYLEVESPEKFVTSGGLGTMGFGLPSAVGVQFGNPEEHVVAIAGDGSFQMNVQELQTIYENRLPIVMVILNNGQLGMVKQWQELFFGERYSATILKDQPDFVKLADAYSIKGRRVINAEDLGEAIEVALKSREPYLLDVITDPAENVFPMVPAGGSLKNMLK